ncbi:MAG: AbrB/MazE/SpoVT family DNA-binding domain-containing protein [Nitrososphaerales archaeon]
MATDIVVGKEGRLVLPKKIRDRYGVKEGDRILVREFGSQILLIPVDRYDKPTKALHGSVRARKIIDEPKDVARKYIRRKLAEEFA